MNTATVLVTRPRKLNDPTSVTYQWAEKIIDMSKRFGYNVIDLKETEVTYDNVNRVIGSYGPRLYVHAGHGCPTSLQGQNECIITRRFGVDELLSMQNFKQILQPLAYKAGCVNTCSLDKDPCNPLCFNETNVNLLKGTITLAIACFSGEQLGKCAEKYGASAYIGYKDLYLFPVDSKGSEDMFRDVHLVFMRELLSGKTVAEAEKVMNLYEDHLIRIHKGTKFVALPMLWNKLNRVIWGNKNSRIYG